MTKISLKAGSTPFFPSPLFDNGHTSYFLPARPPARPLLFNPGQTRASAAIKAVVWPDYNLNVFKGRRRMKSNILTRI